MSPSRLAPDSPIGILRIVLDGPGIQLEAALVGSAATCPACQTPSTRIPARYVRRPTNSPWRGHRVRLKLSVRRFRCDNPTCIVRPSPRTAATQELLAIAMAAGGEEGSRLAWKLKLPTSPDTLLRLQRRMPLPEYPTPRVLGIDDLSLRRRQTDATLFVDLEHHKTIKPIDLVEGRDAEVVEKRLKERAGREQAGIEVSVRDRSGAYADGARAGAPLAKQTADRFHLVQNASNALDELLRSHRRQSECPRHPLLRAS